MLYAYLCSQTQILRRLMSIGQKKKTTKKMFDHERSDSKRQFVAKRKKEKGKKETFVFYVNYDEMLLS